MLAWWKDVFEIWVDCWRYQYSHNCDAKVVTAGRGCPFRSFCFDKVWNRFESDRWCTMFSNFQCFPCQNAEINIIWRASLPAIAVPIIPNGPSCGRKLRCTGLYRPWGFHASQRRSVFWVDGILNWTVWRLSSGLFKADNIALLRMICNLHHDISKQPRWHHPRCVSVRWGLVDFMSASYPPPPRFLLLFLCLLVASSAVTICARLICKLFNGTLHCQVQAPDFQFPCKGPHPEASTSPLAASISYH